MRLKAVIALPLVVIMAALGRYKWVVYMSGHPEGDFVMKAHWSDAFMKPYDDRVKGIAPSKSNGRPFSIIRHQFDKVVI